MKLFLTGATGFIGQHLVRCLAATAHRMRCLVRPASDTRFLEEAGAELVRGEVKDREALRAGMKECEGVVHLANVYSFWERDPRRYRAVNVEGTRRVMECALEAGVAKVAHVSTVGVWGKPATSPFTEETPFGPVRFSEYARTKHEGDRLAWELHRQQGLPLVVLYPAAVLGPGDPKASGQYLADLVRGRMPARVLADAVLTWVHVRDVAQAMVRVLEKEGNIGERYIVGKHRLSLGEFNRMASEISGVPLSRLRLPDFLALGAAALFTGISRLSRRPPPWGMSWDQVRTTRAGFGADGSKAERELGLVYTPIRQAVEESIAALFSRGVQSHATLSRFDRSHRQRP